MEFYNPSLSHKLEIVAFGISADGKIMAQG